MDFDSPRVQLWDCIHVKKDVKKHDIYIKLKSYKLPL